MRFLVTLFVLMGLARAATASPQESLRGNLFDIQPKNQVEVFVADDVPDSVKKGVTDTLAMAVKTWGSSGRLEYWVMGTDRNAAMKLSEAFCERRVARGHMTSPECLRDRFNKDHGFLSYQEIGARSLANGSPSMSAGHNGGSEWGFHRYSSSLPFGFAGKLDVAGEGDQLTIFHEYWHSIQQAWIKAPDHATRQEQMGPVWFAEGSAVAMAELTTEKLWSSGQLPRWNNTGRPWPDLRQRMTSKMNFIRETRGDCKSALPDTYEGDCGRLAYESGGWAMTYLMHQHGWDVLQESFHPKVAELGWEGAFQATFGQGSEKFIAEFEAFLDLPLEEQLKILPSF